MTASLVKTTGTGYSSEPCFDLSYPERAARPWPKALAPTASLANLARGSCSESARDDGIPSPQPGNAYKEKSDARRQEDDSHRPVPFPPRPHAPPGASVRRRVD